MARIESLKKMGYFRTPDKSTEKIVNLLSFEGNQPFQILDPCCGEGIVLKKVSSVSQNIITYGVELDQNRAARSQQVLNKVVNCSIFDADITKQTHGLLWLNPPYSDDRDSNNKSIRTELKFLIKSIDWLAPSGVIVYIIPDYIVNQRLAKFFTSHFDRISVFKFVPEEYTGFKQVVIFGIKRDKPEFNEIAAMGFIKSVQSAPFFNSCSPVDNYLIPPTPAPKLFRSKTPSIEEITAEIKKSKLSAEVYELTKIEDRIGKIKTVMPISKGHLATLLVAGFLDGVVEKNGNRILVKGYSKKISIERIEEGEGKNPITKLIKTDKVMVAVRYVDENGILTNIN